MLSDALKFYELVTTDNFYIGRDNFEDLEISPTEEGNFYYFLHKTKHKLIKQFVLDDRKLVRYICQVTLIKKGDKFTPRLAFSIRDKSENKILSQSENETEKIHNIKANVNLAECHENLWKLILFLQPLCSIDIPQGTFSLISQAESEIVAALHGRNAESIKDIIKQLSSTEGLFLSQADINQLLKRKEKLVEFEEALVSHKSDEGWWQDFFEQNKWIFGYGLNYQILRQEQAQPHYGGTDVSGRGGQRGDYLTSTVGDSNFTVLVEIKTPSTPLLQGSDEIRNGAWSLSKNLTDALSQIEANIYTWEKEGSEQHDNRDKLENDRVYTVQPKGILVLGSLSEMKDVRNKRETFQRFRKSIHGIDIITFDELYNRAKFIIEGGI